MPLGHDSSLAEKMPVPLRVLWLTWADALAAVWRDESTRQQWLGKADQSALELRQRVEAIRRADLSSV